MSTQPRKWKQGVLVESVDELILLIEAENWFWIGGRPKHPVFVANMGIIRLVRRVREGSIFTAERIE